MNVLLVLSEFAYLTLLFLSAGGVLFYVTFEKSLGRSEKFIAPFLRGVSLAAMSVALFFPFLDAIKFTGSWEGIFDIAIQKLIFLSHLGVFKVVVFLGTVFLAASAFSQAKAKNTLGVVGVALVAFSFSYTGHTAEHSLRLILAPLLIFHLVIIMFWYGALVPLLAILKSEDVMASATVLEQFSKAAVVIVPLIFVAGLIMSITLMGGVNFFEHQYGKYLVLKIILFSGLLLLAGFNKWRLVPAHRSGDERASQRLQQSITAEFIIISMVILVTVILTGYYSPQEEY